MLSQVNLNMKAKVKYLYFQALFATSIWGAAYPFTKFAISEISPLTLVFIRAFVASSFLFFISRKTLSFDFSSLWKIVIMSILGVSLQQYAQASALKYTLASNAGWLIALTPIMVVFLQVIQGEKISFLKVSGFLLGFIGTLLVIFGQKGISYISFVSTKGDIIFLFTCFAWALYVILTKKWFEKEKQLNITTITMIVALISISPFFIAEKGWNEIPNLSMKGWICVAYLSFLSSCIAYLFWNNSVEGLGPTKTSYFIYDEPFAAMISSYFLLEEKINMTSFIGGIVILMGVYFVNCKKMKCPLKERFSNG